MVNFINVSYIKSVQKPGPIFLFLHFFTQEMGSICQDLLHHCTLRYDVTDNRERCTKLLFGRIQLQGFLMAFPCNSRDQGGAAALEVTEGSHVVRSGLYLLHQKSLKRTAHWGFLFITRGAWTLLP